MILGALYYMVGSQSPDNREVFISNKAIAEFIGTFILVFFGVGSAVLMGAHIGFQGIAFAFGLLIVEAAYGFGVISGAQLNPAVSLGFLASGRMGMADFITYCIAQVLDATQSDAPIGFAGLAIGLTLAGGLVAGVLRGAGITRSPHARPKG